MKETLKFLNIKYTFKTLNIKLCFLTSLQSPFIFKNLTNEYLSPHFLIAQSLIEINETD